MDVPSHSATEEPVIFTVLVTGANSGLGFAICCRLIDDFLRTRPQSHTLHLLFSTRDTSKSEDTRRRLQAHLQQTLRRANGTTLGISRLLEARVRLEGVLVDLLRLASVQALAEQLLRRRGDLRLDALVWNAGIPGWSGLNWPKAVWHIVTDLVHASTYPTFANGIVGLEAKPQQLQQQQQSEQPEPKLGQVFTANVFGHYLLTHWLRPLLHADSRIVWISSISAVPDTFDAADLQGLRATSAYEGSKRLTDLLVLTSELPSTQPYVHAFLPSSSNATTITTTTTISSKQNLAGVRDDDAASARGRPRMYVTHPGVIGTSIAGLHWILDAFMAAAFFLSRWLGSPWHLVEPYKGAVSAVFAVLHPGDPEEWQGQEGGGGGGEGKESGKAKWGAAIDVRGRERVARTEVEGWAYCGRVGVVPPESVVGSRGRYRYRRETTAESREQFEETGRLVWREMEQLRIEWERRLGRIGGGAG